MFICEAGGFTARYLHHLHYAQGADSDRNRHPTQYRQP